MEKRSNKTDKQAPGASAEEGDALMGIADMCAAFDVSPRTLRFYESKGLLSPQRLGRTRVYAKNDRARLSRILRAKSLGMPLDEIKQYLDMYGEHGEGRIQQLTYVIKKSTQAIADLETKRAQIDAALAELRLILANTQKRLESRQGKR